MEVSSDTHSTEKSAALEPATVIYHESAHSIVFRDQLRRKHEKTHSSASVNTSVTLRSAVETSSSTASSKKHKRRSRKHKSSSSTSRQHKSSSSQASDSSINQSEDQSYATDSDASLSMSTHSIQPNIIEEVRPRGESIATTAAAYPSMNTTVGGGTMSASQTQTHDISSIDYADSSDHGTKKSKDRSKSAMNAPTTKPGHVIIANYTPAIEPLPAFDLGPHTEFTELLESAPYIWEEGMDEPIVNKEVWDQMTSAERNVSQMFLEQKCVVKTVKNADWTSFLQKFVVEEGSIGGRYSHPGEGRHWEKKPVVQDDKSYPFHSFITSTTLLPSCGLKVRCYGSEREYGTGVVFALPTKFQEQHEDDNDTDASTPEDRAAEATMTWSWPSGYAAKTEFNIDQRSGQLINGRKEALVSMSSLRRMNHSFLHDTDYEILGRLVKGGLGTVPYNEVFLRVGGMTNPEDKSFEEGVGLPVALFIRNATYGDLVSLLRLRARHSTVLGRDYIHGIPLLLLQPKIGIRVLTEDLQKKLLQTMSNNLNPFQNKSIQHKTTIDKTSDAHLKIKLEELLDLDEYSNILTPEECARLAGGFGATDESIAHLLKDAVMRDSGAHSGGSKEDGKDESSMSYLITEGLAAAVRSGDYHTSRQLLILYSLVSSQAACKQQESESKATSKQGHSVMEEKGGQRSCMAPTNNELSENYVPPPPPPPPLDTDRLRSATNSDGLLAVLGAAEILKGMKDGGAKRRSEEAAQAIEEWIEKSDSITYRLASWREQRAAQGDLKIATEQETNFMAFISNKAISNRKKFAMQLRESVSKTNFETIHFLTQMHSIVSTMHSPCLRLELLQFILGLDNRYSIAHVARSLELAATCLNISALSSEQEHPDGTKLRHG